MEITIKDVKEPKDIELEAYVRELEAVNDSLQDENDELRDQIQQAAEMKAEEAIAEVKRGIIEKLEEMPAERYKEIVLSFVSEILTED